MCDFSIMGIHTAEKFYCIFTFFKSTAYITDIFVFTEFFNVCRMYLKYIAIISLLMIACTGNKNKLNNNNIIIRIETTYGDMDIKLYDETPLHRDNFVNLISKGFYNDLIFHRVINNFMVQGGDPGSKNSGSQTNLGSGGPGYTISAEISNKLFHKKGAIAAARQGDDTNPLKESSGSQFYLVHGTIFTNQQLRDIELKINNDRKQKRYLEVFRDLEKEYINDNREPDYKNISERAAEIVTNSTESGDYFEFSDQQKEIYTTIGGTPHLDGSYTVFGEVITGFDVIDIIASQKTGPTDRPLSDIKMKIIILKN